MAEEYVLGRHAVIEALRSGRKVRRLLVSGRGGRRSPAFEEAVTLASGKNVPVHSVREEILDRLGPHHNGIAAEVESYPYLEVSELIESVMGSETPPLILVLDEVQDPQNFGTLFRTAAALGAHGAILPRHRSAGVTPAVERASAGGVSRLLIARATNLVRAIEDLQKAGIWVFGIDARAPERYDKTDLTGPIAIVVGSEGEGLGRLVRERCDKVIRVPMAGAMESLNVSVAGSIVLAEVFRQREAAGQAAEGPLPPEPVRTRTQPTSVALPPIELDEDEELEILSRAAAKPAASRAPRPKPLLRTRDQKPRSGVSSRTSGPAGPKVGSRDDASERGAGPGRPPGPSRGGTSRPSGGPRGAGSPGGFRGGQGGPPKRGPSRPGGGNRPRRSGGGGRSR